MVIRQHVSEIRVLGRNTQGVKLIKLQEKDHITGIGVVASDDSDDDENGLEDGAADGVTVNGTSAE
jgi:DNA gyrase subunit A